MRTVTIQIGNTDGKLTQDQWSAYVEECDIAIRAESCAVHFKGGPPVWEKWQNVCWVVLTHEAESTALKTKIKAVRTKYSQDSVAWTMGETEFI